MSNLIKDVYLQKGSIDSGNSLNQAFVAGGDLEFLEETGHDTGRGGPGEADLVINDDRGVDAGADQGVDHDVEVSLQGGGGVTHGDSPVNKSGELLLKAFNGLAQALQLLDLNLGLLLVNVDNLKLAAIDALLDALIDALTDDLRDAIIDALLGVC